MNEESERSNNFKYSRVCLVAILVIGLLFRLPDLGHTLSWDEAWNVCSVWDVASGVSGESTSFYPDFFRHPPLYLGLGVAYSMVTGHGKKAIATALQLLSIILSLLLMVVIYLCGRDWFGTTTGLAASFLYALMPASRVYDTWVKPESMTLLLGLLFLFFFFRRRSVVAGIFLGLAFLAKEIVIFLPAAVFLFALILRRFDELKRLALSALLALGLSLWWFLFFSITAGNFLGFFLGGDPSSSETWAQPWYFYVTRIPSDIGWGGALAVFAGCAVFVRQLPLTEKRDSSVKQYAPYEMALFLIIWIITTYIVLSFSVGKPPWMTYAALPAFALLGGWGICESVRLLSGRRVVATVLLIAWIALVFATAAPISFDRYVRSGDVMYEDALRDREVAERINAGAGNSSRVMMRDLDLSPITAFYLDSYKPGSMVSLPLEPSSTTSHNQSSILLLADTSTLDNTLNHLKREKPDFLLLRAPGKLTDELATIMKPEDYPARQAYYQLFDLSNTLRNSEHEK